MVYTIFLMWNIRALLSISLMVTRWERYLVLRSTQVFPSKGYVPTVGICGESWMMAYSFGSGKSRILITTRSPSRAWLLHSATRVHTFYSQYVHYQTYRIHDWQGPICATHQGAPVLGSRSETAWFVNGLGGKLYECVSYPISFLCLTLGPLSSRLETVGRKYHWVLPVSKDYVTVRCILPCLSGRKLSHAVCNRLRSKMLKAARPRMRSGSSTAWVNAAELVTMGPRLFK